MGVAVYNRKGKIPETDLKTEAKVCEYSEFI